VGFLNLWCHIVVEVVGGFCRLVVGDVEGVRLAHAAEAVAVGGGCFGGAAARTETLASIPTGEGSRQCTGAMRVLHFLC
jgi:hypothetical protein